MIGPDTLLADYYADWVRTYKTGGRLRLSTQDSYAGAVDILRLYAPNLRLGELGKRSYQELLNRYAGGRRKNSVKHFHNLVKPALMDAIDDNLVPGNTLRRVVIKGEGKRKERNWLSVAETAALCREFELEKPIVTAAERRHSRGYELATNWDWLFLLVLKTGLRFSEALGLFPEDFDLEAGTLSVRRTYDYKFGHVLREQTKTRHSARTVALDGATLGMFAGQLSGMERGRPFFIPEGQKAHNRSANNRLRLLCDRADVPAVDIHGLRHTHGSLLLYAGVSLKAIQQRLGHSSPSLTMNVYMHVVEELETQDREKLSEGMGRIFLF